PRPAGRGPARFVNPSQAKAAAASAAAPLTAGGAVNPDQTKFAMEGSVRRAGLPDAPPGGPAGPAAPALTRPADPNAPAGALSQGGRQQAPAALASDLAAMKNSPVNSLKAPVAEPAPGLVDSFNALKGWLGEKWQAFRAPPAAKPATAAPSPVEVPPTPAGAAPHPGGAPPAPGEGKPVTREELLGRLSEARDLPPNVQAGLMDMAQRLMMHDTALLGLSDRLTRGRPDPRLQLEYFLLKGDVQSAALVYKALLAGSGQGPALDPDEEQALAQAMAPLGAERERRAPEVAREEASRQVREERRDLAAKLITLSAKLSRGLQLPDDDDLALLRRLDPAALATLKKEGMLEDRFAGRVEEALSAFKSADSSPGAAERHGVLGAFSYEAKAAGAWERLGRGERLSPGEEGELHRAVTRSLMRKLDALRAAGPSAELSRLEGMLAAYRSHRADYAAEAAQRIPALANPVERILARYRLAEEQIALEPDAKKRLELQRTLGLRYADYASALEPLGQTFLKRMEGKRAEYEETLLRPAMDLRSRLALLESSGGAPAEAAALLAERDAMRARILKAADELDNRRMGTSRPIYEHDTVDWLVRGLRETAANLSKPAAAAAPDPAAALSRLEDLQAGVRSLRLSDEEKKKAAAGLFDPVLAELRKGLKPGPLAGDLAARSQDVRLRSELLPDYAALLESASRGALSAEELRRRLDALDERSRAFFAQTDGVNDLGLPNTELAAGPETLALHARLRAAVSAWLEPPPDALESARGLWGRLSGGEDPGRSSARSLVELYAGRVAEGRTYDPAALGLAGAFPEGTRLEKRTFSDPWGGVHEGLAMLGPGAKDDDPRPFESLDGRYRVTVTPGPDGRPRFVDTVLSEEGGKRLQRRNLSPGPDTPWGLLHGRIGKDGAFVPEAAEFFDGAGKRKSAEVVAEGLFGRKLVSDSELRDEKQRRANTVYIGVRPDDSTPPKQRDRDEQVAQAHAAAKRLLTLSGPELSKHGTPSEELLARALYLSDRVGERDYAVIGKDGKYAPITSKSLTVQGEWVIVANRFDGGVVRYDTYRFEKSSSFKKEGGGQDALIRHLPVYVVPPELQETAGLRVTAQVHRDKDGASMTSQQRLDLRPAPSAPDPARRPLKDEQGRPLTDLALRGTGRAAEFLPGGTDLEWIRREAVKSNAGISDLWSSNKHVRELFLWKTARDADWMYTPGSATEKVRATSEDMAGTSGLAQLGALVHDVPVAGHILGGLGWVGSKGTGLVMGGLNIAAGDALGAVGYNSEGLVHGPAYLERMAGSDPKDPAVIARVKSFYDDHPEARKTLDTVAKTQRLLRIKALLVESGSTPESFAGYKDYGPGKKGYESMLWDALNDKVTDGERAAALVQSPYLTARGIARAWSEHGAETGQWGWSAGAVALNMGEGYLESLPTLLALGAAGRLGAAAGATTTPYAALNVGLRTVAGANTLMSAYVQASFVIGSADGAAQAAEAWTSDPARRDEKLGEAFLNAGFVLSHKFMGKKKPSADELGAARGKLEKQMSYYEVERARLAAIEAQGKALSRSEARWRDHLESSLPELAARHTQLGSALVEMKLKEALGAAPETLSAKAPGIDAAGRTPVTTPAGQAWAYLTDPAYRSNVPAYDVQRARSVVAEARGTLLKQLDDPAYAARLRTLLKAHGVKERVVDGAPVDLIATLRAEVAKADIDFAKPREMAAMDELSLASLFTKTGKIRFNPDPAFATPTELLSGVVLHEVTHKVFGFGESGAHTLELFHYTARRNALRAEGRAPDGQPLPAEGMARTMSPLEKKITGLLEVRRKGALTTELDRIYDEKLAKLGYKDDLLALAKADLRSGEGRLFREMQGPLERLKAMRENGEWNAVPDKAAKLRELFLGEDPAALDPRTRAVREGALTAFERLRDRHTTAGDPVAAMLAEVNGQVAAREAELSRLRALPAGRAPRPFWERLLESRAEKPASAEGRLPEPGGKDASFLSRLFDGMAGLKRFVPVKEAVVGGAGREARRLPPTAAEVRAVYETLPESLRSHVSKSYGETAAAALPEAIARLMKTTEMDPAWWSDHGINHMINIVANMSGLLSDVQGSGLVAQRDVGRAAFMEGAGKVNAGLHDMWMKVLTKKGRDLHPSRAAREAFAAELDQAAADILAMKLANGRTFRDALLKEYGVPEADIARVTREIMAMSYAHSKSNVPLEVLNDPARLREAMKDVTLSRDKNTAEYKAKEGVDGEALPGELKPYRRFYERGGKDLFEAMAFDWVETNPRLAQDMIDVSRSLRLADAMRWRGSADFRGSQGASIVAAELGGQMRAVMRLADPKSGRTYLVAYDSKLALGEANIAATRIAPDGNLVVGLEKGSFGSKANDAQMAQATAKVIVDIYRDYVGSFNDAAARRLVLERAPGEARGFSESVVEALLKEAAKEEAKHPGLTAMVKKAVGVSEAPAAFEVLAEAQRRAGEHEAQRFDKAERAFLSEREMGVLRRALSRGGTDVEALDLGKAVEGARMMTLGEGDLLMARGAPGEYVYIPLAGGLRAQVGKTYAPVPTLAGVPVGELGVLTGNPRVADITAGRDGVRVLAIPKATYLREWTRSIYTHETILDRLKRDYPTGRDDSGRARRE
ncbi:MAG: hypothetical protein HY928_03300, partial [Elusimicrobia bacterium]|nr:hypothetical protein [Elusimicrobiota bacterium]